MENDEKKFEVPINGNITSGARAPGFAQSHCRHRLSPNKPKSVPCRDAAVFLQPLQFFPYFDLAVPGILAQAVTFAGED
jgi:hypothetical protein